MNVAAGESSPRKLFGVIDLVGPLTAGRALFLVSLGVAIVLLEQAFRWPLQLPGHHGLEAMALLVLGRLSCTNPWSATLVGRQRRGRRAVRWAPDHGVLMPLFYVLPGIVLDARLPALAAARRPGAAVPAAARGAGLRRQAGRARTCEPGVRHAVRLAARRAGLPDPHAPAVRLPRRTRRGAGVARDGAPPAPASVAAADAQSRNSAPST